MPYVKFPLLPGIFKDESPLKAKGYFVDGDGVRVCRGGMESVYGYEKATLTTFLGICRCLASWRDNGGAVNTFIGTHLRAYCFHDGQIYDITPAIARGQITNPFTTTNGTATTVTHVAHGCVVDQKVSFANATAVGGITISGDYVVQSITDLNHYVITTAAASAAGPGGGTVDYTYFLAPGLADSIGGAGFGTGGYGMGPYGFAPPATTTLSALTWSAHNWGEEMLYCPRGGAIYSFNPTGGGYASQPTELTSNGTFTGSASGWTLGTGWAYGANAVTATASNAALSQPITVRASSYALVQFTVSAFSAGTLQASLDGMNFGGAIAANGKYKVVVYGGSGGAQTLAFTGTGFTGTLDSVGVAQLNYGTIIPNAPTINNCMTVTDQRQVMVGGTIDDDGNYDAMLAKWSDAENYTIWTDSAANLAGSYQFAEGGMIVRILNARGEILVFTDVGLYTGQHVLDQNLVYQFGLMGRNCGLIGFNAAIVTDAGAFWMAPGGSFYVYRGGPPTPIRCPTQRGVLDHLDWAQNDKIVAYSNAATNEVGWLYADLRDAGNEISREVRYNYIEDAWAVGTTTATFRLDRGIEPYPFATDPLGQLRFVEKGLNGDGGALSGSLTTAFFDIGDGDQYNLVTSVMPDFGDLVGGLTLNINARNSSGGIVTTYGPFNINAATTDIPVRIRKREIQLALTWNSAPFFMRLGALRVRMKPAGALRVA
jgi:hypothetical protein